jgi:polysaccharide biosynthesis protein PslH
MRIVWVKVGGLWPLNTGGRQRTFHIVTELARRHRVSLLTTHGADDDPSGLAERLGDCHSVQSVPADMPKQGTRRFASALGWSWLSVYPVDLWRCRVPALSRAVEATLASGDVDVCVVDFLAAMPNVPPLPVPLVLFEHNVEHMIWKRLAEVERRPWRRALLEVEWRKMRRYEAAACQRARRTIAVSEPDRFTLSALAPGADIHVIPTGVDSSYFAANGWSERPASLVFSGSMDWYPNEDAVLHFIDAILPRIRREIPEVTLTVAGRNPRPRLRSAASAAGVFVTGTVDDVRPYLAEAAVAIVPLRVGGGTRLKIFEALAMGKAVVSTTVGAEGLPLVPGEHFLQADEPEAFARSVVGLLRQRARRVALGEAGRQLVHTQYSWPVVAREFEARCAEVVGSHAS